MLRLVAFLHLQLHLIVLIIAHHLKIKTAFNLNGWDNNISFLFVFPTLTWKNKIKSVCMHFFSLSTCLMDLDFALALLDLFDSVDSGLSLVITRYI